ncbi:MAG: hemolysin III family protein [Clostridia bacterium]|nr:hemolysin III family protein [Clostridia bacterium]
MMTAKQTKKAFSYPTVGKEIANAITHGIGGGLAVAGTVLLIVKSVAYGAKGVVGACLYGAALIILYTASCIYHALAPNGAKHVFRILDHCSIFVLIFGTYIPAAWMLFGDALGWSIFGVIGGAAALGITLNAIDLVRFDRISQILYLVMGWAIALTCPIVYRAVGLDGMLFLIGGGVAYTAGVFFFRRERGFDHAIWHFFVLGGSVLHYFFIYLYCYS